MAIRQPSSLPAPYSITGLRPYTWLQWWYALSSPSTPVNLESLSLREYEFLRRGKLISIALLIEFLTLFISISAEIQGTNKYFLTLLYILVAVLIIATVLNRLRKLVPAGIVTIVVSILSIVGGTLGVPGSLLGTTQLPLFCLFVQPLVISTLLFSSGWVFLVAVLNVLLMTNILLFLPKTAELQSLLHTQPYLVYSVPIGLQVIVSLISFIIIMSLQESIVQVYRAEEITRLQKIIEETSIKELNAQREQARWIEHVMSVMSRLSNGEADVMLLPMETSTPLWPVSSSINNMISRYARQRVQQQQMELTAFAVQAHLHALREAKATGIPVKWQATGTQADTLVQEVMNLTLPLPRTSSPPSQNKRSGNGPSPNRNGY